MAVDYQQVSDKSPEQLLAMLSSSAEGLSESEAATRLHNLGANELSSHTTRWSDIMLRQFRSVFVYLLLFAAAISFYLHDYLEALLIIVFVGINTLLGFLQEFKTERSLKLLKKFIQRKTRVRREGTEQVINTEHVVPGDIVLLKAGDMIPADGYFLSAKSVSVDQSILTGESQPVDKQAGLQKKIPQDIYEAANIGFSSTTLISGEGQLAVFATGNDSFMGKTATSAGETEAKSNFEIGIDRFSSFILRLVFITVPFIFIINLFIRGHQFNSAQFLIFLIALVVSVVPEALPLVTTLSLTRGALHLAVRHVVPRRLSAIEDLGSIEILCTDKTGTITENKLTVGDMLGTKHDILYWSLLGSVSFDRHAKEQQNVFDRALAHALAPEISEKIHHAIRLSNLPFDPIRKRESVLVNVHGRTMLVVRGAPEEVIPAHMRGAKKIFAWAQQQGTMGRRIIAVAKKQMPKSYRTITPEDEEKVTIVGLVSFFDPLKPSAQRALTDAERLGVRVKIITGDGKEVAGWVAYSAGLIDNPAKVLTGTEFDAMSEDQRIRAVEDYDVFARTVPDQKSHIIAVLKTNYVVGFLGEGFNDAPALKLANVGLAVEGASDIAQDASDIILLNKSLEVVVDGIREGRKVFANIMTYIKATLTSNFGNFYTLAFVSLIVDYLPMLPVQILLLNLLTDFPMISIATDRVDTRDLKRPLRYRVRDIAFAALVLGLVSTAFDFAFFRIFAVYGQKNLQTMWFLGSLLTELVLIFSIRSAHPFFKAERPGFLIIGLTGVAALTGIILPFTPFGHTLFGFTKPLLPLLGVTFGIVVLYFITTEVVKVWFERTIMAKRNHAQA